MIAKLEWTQSNAQQSIKQLQTPTMGVTIDKKSTTTEPPPLKGQQPKPPGGGGSGGLNAFYWYQIFALDSAVVEVKEMFSSHGSLLTNAMNHYGETQESTYQTIARKPQVERQWVQLQIRIKHQPTD